ncbi:GntR family transcriptional regulator [Microbacterium stercoris]|uniref:GntR family transcriptional regulator n=1 Tax=Microbacterium stercoris TaxID=2820289 RepID=A0A939QHN6_9MICO|nr:GntR family transcriptional regulator [Microbacterium stercoris]MBO3663112.1 GntR family transcriptional regulator [Microbacterium stercoris]
MSALAPIDKGKQLLADTVFQFLGAAIIQGELEQGERIRDAELADKLNVSRMPIREALQRLERIGLVEMMPSRFTRVTLVTDEIVKASLSYAGYKCGIELRAALPVMTDAQLERAIQLLDAADAAIGDDDASIDARIACSRYIASLGIETVYSQHLQDLDVALERNLKHVGPMLDNEALRANYVQLRQAMKDRDGDAAERLVRRQFGI